MNCPRCKSLGISISDCGTHCLKCETLKEHQERALLSLKRYIDTHDKKGLIKWKELQPQPR